MPVTINGFGTRYAGRQQVATRRGVCEHCRHEVDLTSYDTRLWICALFVPVVPLGRQRVLDECPRCRRHRVAPLSGYREATGAHLAQCEQAYRQAPRDRQVALAYADALRHYGEAADVTRLLGRLAADFADDAEVQVYVASVHEQRGEREQADRLFDRAYQLDPSYPPARHARAITLIQQGRLGEARGLVLDPRSKPGERDPGVLYMLATACQEQSDQSSALECFRVLLAEQPQLAGDKQLRKRIAAAEQASGALLSILPPRRLPWGKLAAAGVVLALLVGSLVAVDAYLRRHQDLHVVSAWGEPLTVRLDGDRTLRFDQPGRQLITIAEGEHEARFEGATLPPVAFDTRLSLVDRFLERPLYVLDPGGLAVIGWEENVYSARPRPDARRGFRLHAGKPFLALPAVDYPFGELPETINVSTKASEVRKTRVFELVDPPAALLGMLGIYAPPDALLDYLEHWLDAAPSDQLALAYAAVAARADAGARAAPRLRSGLQLAPVNVDRHRAYQLAVEAGGATAELLAEYDGYLQARPDDAALLYLRGRIEPDPERARQLYARAMTIDPADVYAPRALAYSLLTQGSFAEAVAVLRPYGRAADAEAQTRDLYDDLLSAAGEQPELEQSLRARVVRAEGELDWQAAIRLTELLLRSGQTAAAEELAETLAAAQQPGSEGLDLMPVLRGHRLYAAGDGSGLARLASEGPLIPFWQARFRFWGAVERGDLGAVGQSMTQLDDVDRGLHEMVVAVVYARAKLRAQAEKWLHRAVKRLAREEASYRLVESVLDSGREWTSQDLHLLTIQPRDKATLLTALALLSERQRALLLAEATRFDLDTAFPHRLLAGVRDDAALEPPAAAAR